MNLYSASRTLALALLLALSGSAVAADDPDPENGESWLTKAAVQKTFDGLVLAGTIRATDDYGATHDRDFRLASSGSIARGDRSVVLHRFEPECFELAPAARLSLEDYCDQLSLTWRDGDVTLAFSSLDANRRYAFTLRADPRDPGAWQSLPTSVASPTLRLESVAASHGVTYRWELTADDARYGQAGEITSDQLRGTDLNALEASIVGLGEVLLTFNRYAFENAILSRDDPDYRPTPYAAWAEETVEGGCIFAFCFGNLGGGGIGAGNNSNQCSPSSPSYNPAVCPHDLTFARWPVAARPKLQKIDDNQVRFRIHLKNAGTGPVLIGNGGFQPESAFVSLIRVGTITPVTSAASGDNYCRRTAAGMRFDTVDPFVFIDLDPGEVTSMGLTELDCAASTARPDGRYRLFIHIDPQLAHDTPGYQANNIGNSGVLDWVRLRD